jgi:hypothetical protein
METFKVRFTKNLIRGGYYLALFPQVGIASFRERKYLRICLSWLFWGMDIVIWMEGK